MTAKKRNPTPRSNGSMRYHIVKSVNDQYKCYTLTNALQYSSCVYQIDKSSSLLFFLSTCSAIFFQRSTVDYCLTMLMSTSSNSDVKNIKECRRISKNEPGVITKSWRTRSTIKKGVAVILLVQKRFDDAQPSGTNVLVVVSDIGKRKKCWSRSVVN